VTSAAILEEKTIDCVFCVFWWWWRRTLSVVLSVSVYFGRAGTNSCGGSDQLLEIEDKVWMRKEERKRREGFIYTSFSGLTSGTLRVSRVLSCQFRTPEFFDIGVQLLLLWRKKLSSMLALGVSGRSGTQT
jgi:hypothetical protein